MGSRRGYDIPLVVGNDRFLNHAKSEVTKAIDKEDSEAIAIKSAELIARSPNTVDFFYYGLKLLDYLTSHEKSAKDLSNEKVDRALRIEWARIKRRDKIPDNPILDKGVIDSAKRALRD